MNELRTSCECKCIADQSKPPRLLVIYISSNSHWHWGSIHRLHLHKNLKKQIVPHTTLKFPVNTAMMDNHSAVWLCDEQSGTSNRNLMIRAVAGSVLWENHTRECRTFARKLHINWLCARLFCSVYYIVLYPLIYVYIIMKRHYLHWSLFFYIR